MRKEKKKFQNIVAAWRIMGLNFSKNTLESYGIEIFIRTTSYFGAVLM
ncbi:MAG: hypothetical protein LBT29_00105 [Flavobacteriaceae bacterium]|nr:hypothetical protein [Flavobacteriaceae bacterium]